MKIVSSSGRDDLARVYIVESSSGLRVECAESVQPPKPLEEKWVLLVSTLYGCPVGCSMCDAGGEYHGKISAEEIHDQIELMVKRRFPDLRVPSRQFKVQFARMGEPALNPAVLDVLRFLPERIHAPGLMPSISTVAPSGADSFFDDLLSVKNEIYNRGNFQLQFSLHTTCAVRRREIVPVETWTMDEISGYGNMFHTAGDRKITLNFALAQGSPLCPEVLLSHFSPEVFLVKITPLNPTYRAVKSGMRSRIDPCQPEQICSLVKSLTDAGYETIVSIGEQEENKIGSNCGQYLKAHQRSKHVICEGYTYPISKLAE